MRIIIFIFVIFLAADLTAQVDKRRTAVTPEQDTIRLDSTHFDLGIDKTISTIEIIGNFSGMLRLYGVNNSNIFEAYHVFSANLRDNRAKGLREVTSGTNDNTGVGLNVVSRDGVLQIRPASDFYKNKHFSLFIPNDIPVTIKGTGYGGNIEVRDINAPLTMRKLQASVKVINPRQQVEVETQRNIEVVCSSPPAFPIKLSSFTGWVDISIPKSSDVSIELRNDRVSPRIFSDLPIRMIAKEPTMQTYQLNDGVNRIDLFIPYGNVYIRATDADTL